MDDVVKFLVEIKDQIELYLYQTRERDTTPKRPGIMLAYSARNPDVEKAYQSLLKTENQRAPQQSLSFFTTTEQDGANLIIKEGDDEMRYPPNLRFRQKTKNLIEARVHILGVRFSVYGKTKQECVEKYKARKDEFLKQAKKKSVAPKKTLYAYIEEQIERKAKKIGTDAIKEYRRNFKNHIQRLIPNCVPTKLTIEDVERLNDVEFGRVRENCFQLLNQTMRRLQILGVIKTNVCMLADIIPHERAEGRALSVGEERELCEKALESCLHPYIFHFYLLTGCRRSEALSVRWDYIDEEKGTIFINGTKTKKSKRYIPLFPDLKKLLAKIPKTSEFIFDIALVTLVRDVNRLKKALSFDFEIKDLRTTFGTRHAEAGVQKTTLAKWMGHTTTRTTEQYYIKILPEFEKVEAEKRKTDFFDDDEE